MATVHDYFNGTKAVWHALPQGWCRKLLGVPQTIRLGNHTFVLQHESPSSSYWVSQDGQYLVRLSDHWPKLGNHEGCGWVATCWWELDRTPSPVEAGRKLFRGCPQRVAWTAAG